MSSLPDRLSVQEGDCLSSAPDRFEWPRYPEADAILRDLTKTFLEYHQYAGRLSSRMINQTSTRFFDWIDHIRVHPDHPALALLLQQEFVPATHIKEEDGTSVFWHPHAVFPYVVIDPNIPTISCAIAVESLDLFVDATRLDLGSYSIDGPPGAAIRQLHINEGTNRFTILERHGDRGFIIPADGDPGTIQKCKDVWNERRTHLEAHSPNDSAALDDTLKTAQLLALRIGQSRAADTILSCEREYWMSRNTAGQIQKKRLDALGLGWGKIRDHHTFRSSRENFLGLVQIFLALGFKKRERYYAGDAHGWGAQIMEHPDTADVLFLDVDLFPDEASIDFSVKPLEPRSSFHTVGRWCALHGDSILQSGMHHLEAQFDFAALKQDLEQKGIQTMDKFSDFPFLQQAFTTGEQWPVHPDRLAIALQKGAIDEKTATRIREDGHAIGSHLENLERNEGYKGFNKSGVDAILCAIDPQRADVQRDIATTLVKGS